MAETISRQQESRRSRAHHGSLRAAAVKIHVAAAIDRNATIAAGNVELDSAAIIGRNAYIVGGAIQANGTVARGARSIRRGDHARRCGWP